MNIKSVKDLQDFLNLLPPDMELDIEYCTLYNAGPYGSFQKHEPQLELRINGMGIILSELDVTRKHPEEIKQFLAKAAEENVLLNEKLRSDRISVLQKQIQNANQTKTAAEQELENLLKK